MFSLLVYGPKKGSIIFLAGVVIPFLSLILLFFTGTLGGGDIKLLSVAGCFTGTGVVYIILYSFISGGILSLIYIFKNHFVSAMVQGKIHKQIVEKKGRIHFSLAILCGTLYYFYRQIGGI